MKPTHQLTNIAWSKLNYKSSRNYWKLKVKTVYLHWPEPGTFSGDPLQFPIWLKAFETLIESRTLNPAERLHFLGKYVTGEAKELIKGFMLLDGEDAYQKAKGNAV